MASLELEQFKAKLKNKQSFAPPSFDFFYWADVFMVEYRMSFKEFSGLNIPAFLGLRAKIMQRNQQQADKVDAANLKSGKGKKSLAR